MLAKISKGEDLPAVRRLEAVGFRAWPAASTLYDGSWQVRLTPGHRSKRLNCIVPLDPADCRDIVPRLAACRARFEAAGEVLTVRETPLAPPLLIDHLRQAGWERFETVEVMVLDLDQASLPETMDHLPLQDAARFADACVALNSGGTDDREQLLSILAAIKPQTGYFLIDDVEKGPRATVLAIQDNDLAGIQSLGVAVGERRKGIATEILSAALRWARLRGAKKAWLQVSAANRPAIALYEKIGFQSAYSYHYWREA